MIISRFPILHSRIYRYSLVSALSSRVWHALMHLEMENRMESHCVSLKVTGAFPFMSSSSPKLTLWRPRFVGKSAASIVIDLSNIHMGHAEIFNTHFYSAGDQFPDEWRRAHRLSQAYQLACLARDSSHMGRHVFVVCLFSTCFISQDTDALAVRRPQFPTRLSRHARPHRRRCTPRCLVDHPSIFRVPP